MAVYYNVNNEMLIMILIIRYCLIANLITCMLFTFHHVSYIRFFENLLWLAFGDEMWTTSTVDLPSGELPT